MCFCTPSIRTPWCRNCPPLHSKLDTAHLSGTDNGRGHNMTTASGLPVWPMDMRDEDIRIWDIASHLSRECRFRGALRDDVELYTVAQHSCLVCDNAPDDIKLEALLHDAAEYLTGDMSKPLKLHLPDFVAVSNNIEAAIRRRFKLPAIPSPVIKYLDYRAVLTERRDVLPMNMCVDWGVPKATAWPEKIVPWGVFKSRHEFLQRFEHYKGDLS